MRTDDVRRFCLTCSERTGRLVQRRCPSLDRERAIRTTRQQEQARTAAERKRQAELARRCVDEVDVERIYKRLSQLKTFPPSRFGTPPPPLKLRRAIRPQNCAVRWGSDSILISVWPGRTPEDVVGWMLWGLAKHYTWRSGSERPLSALIGDAADEAWPGLERRSGSTDDEMVAAVIEALTASRRLR